MAEQRHLRNAPITEAIIDLRVKLAPQMQNLQLLSSLHEQIHERFPQKKEIQQVEYQFQAGPPPTQSATSTHIGYRYDSANGRHVIQARLDGFTFSWLKPYDTWESLRDETYEMWKSYRDIMQPEAIIRVATRYINQIDIPGPSIDFDDYLTVAPVIPKALPQVFIGFFSRIVVPDKTNELMAIITQACQPGPSPNLLPVILDIEVIKEKLFENHDLAWSTIDTLRSFKNLIFFDSITEKTAQLFE
jgi:uncharacterized protein (TIGR04255 family)